MVGNSPNASSTSIPIDFTHIGAPGRIIRLDETLNWPRGIKDAQEKFDRSVDVKVLQAMKGIQFVVGEEDNVVHGGDDFWKWLEEVKQKKCGKARDEKDGHLARMRTGRLQMAREIVEEWRGLGVEARFEVVPGAAHNSNGVLNVVKSFWNHLLLRCMTRKSTIGKTT